MNTLFKYIITGSFAVFSLMCILLLLVEVFNVNKVVASAIAFVVASVINYSLQHRFVYQCTGGHDKHALRFFLVTVVGLGINSLLFPQLLKVMDIYLLAQLVTIVAVFMFSFIMNTKFTFCEGAA